MFSKFYKNRGRIYSFFVYFIIFLASIFPYGDADWGWHYRYGEYFFKNGKILTSDIYSWTLPGFKWINHSWGYDLILYVLTNIAGFIGLSLIGAFINLLSFYFITVRFKLTYWKKAILGMFFILFSEAAVLVGLRSQVLSLMLFAILIYILLRSKEQVKTVFLLPLLYFFWANLHGDFTLGLGITSIFLSSYFLIDWYQTKKFNQKIFLFYTAALIASLIAILINPFGYQVFFESFRHLFNPYLKNVYEWMPIYDNCGYCHPSTFGVYILILIGAFTIYLKNKNYFAIPFLITAIIMAYPTIDSRRLLPIFAIITLPFLADVLNNIKWNISKYKSENYLVILIIIISLCFNFYNRFTSNNLYNYTENEYCTISADCSVEIVNYLISHPPKGRGFNSYNIGGYLIGRGIHAKLFIDGRMHIFTREDGYRPFGDYIDMYYHKNYEKFRKYNFDWVLIENTSDLGQKLSSGSELGIWKQVIINGHYTYFVRIR